MADRNYKLTKRGRARARASARKAAKAREAVGLSRLMRARRNGQR